MSDDRIRLPVVAEARAAVARPTPTTSAAATTAFCAVEVNVGRRWSLWLDGNGKITAGNGTLEEPRPNALSLVNGADCPFRTPTCEASCYVHGIEKHAPDTFSLYKHNARTIREILGARPFDGNDAASDLADWIESNAQGGFRWHVSGDIISLGHAQWIALVARYARVPQWIYTRSFPFLEPLLAVSTTRGGSLAINLSCDRDNHWLARRYAEQHGLRLCYLVDDSGVTPELPAGSVLFPDYGLRGRGLAEPTDGVWWQGLTDAQRKQVCPVDFFGKSEAMRCGPCRKCLR